MVVFVVPARVHADSWRCGNRLVSLGDVKREVEEICGSPLVIEILPETILVKTYERIPKSLESNRETSKKNKHIKSPHDVEDGYELINETESVLNVEEWTYNLGSNSFIRTLRFENGRLVSIKEGSYGFDKKDRNLHVKIGDSKAIVLMKYGLTTDIQKNSSHNISVKRKNDGDYLYIEEHSFTVTEEEWIYDLGPDKYLQQFIFKNDCLVAINSLKTKGRVVEKVNELGNNESSYIPF